MAKRRSVLLLVILFFVLVAIPVILLESRTIRSDVAILIEVFLIFLFGCNLFIVEAWANAKDADKNVPGLPPELFTMLKNLSDIKAEALPQNMQHERHHIRALVGMARRIKPSTATQAILMEQTLSQKITTLAAACDRVLAGGDAKEVQKCIDELETVLKQRRDLKSK